MLKVQNTYAKPALRKQREEATAKRIAAREEKKIRAAVDKAYILAFNGVPVDGLRLPELFAHIRAAVLQTIREGNGSHLAARLKELRAQYGEEI